LILLEKYRLQSNSIATVWLLCQQLIERLVSSSSSIEFEYGDTLPYAEYFALIDRHYGLRVECEQINASLDIYSKQFRAIQKRLLSKLKDKTPTQLDNLDTLLENSCQQVQVDRTINTDLFDYFIRR
jgi:Bardet-Biedl syndrome 9 protein